MVSKKLVVANASGLQIRPADILVRAAEQCGSSVEILFEHNIINAKSLLNILSAAIVQGDEIELRCTGPEEEEDLKHLIKVMEQLD